MRPAAPLPMIATLYEVRTCFRSPWLAEMSRQPTGHAQRASAISRAPAVFNQRYADSKTVDSRGFSPLQGSCMRSSCRRTPHWVIGATALLAALASAQTYYKWTDEHGTVHFSDQPPPRGKSVEERVMAPPPREAEAAAPTPAETRGEPTQGPAQVVIFEQDVEWTGPNAVRVSGKLRNSGGSPARQIAIVVKAADAVQGNPCLEREVAPSAQELPPRAEASFESEISDPCLFGHPPVELSARWE
ncbi:MAG: hypothetical protein KatS3mg077_3306 [Candidatus Binatia bacterium]|nr:MAG: hypothetical protein KatS3mg077_3306 [Candidatus Binatia bacterium]